MFSVFFQTGFSTHYMFVNGEMGKERGREQRERERGRGDESVLPKRVSWKDETCVLGGLKGKMTNVIICFTIVPEITLKCQKEQI